MAKSKSVKRITKLTPAQEAQLAPHADKWIEIGLRTGETDLETFTDGAQKCYEAAGIAWPGVVVSVSSPLVMAIAAPVAALLLEMQERGELSGPVDNAVSDAVGGVVNDAVGPGVASAVVASVVGAVRSVMDATAGDAPKPKKGAAADLTGEAFRKAVADVIRQCGNRYVGRYWWIHWQAWSTFFRDHCNLELEGDLWDRSRAHQQCTESGGYWFPHKHFVMVADRPQEIHREEIGPRGWNSHRLHNDKGPSISWRRDGWALYHIHGVRVTEQIVLRPETLTVEQVFQEENAEVRRVMIERMPGGWLGFAETANLKMIDECADPANAPNMIRLYELPEGIREVLGTPVRLITCRNATPERDGTVRDFGLTVPDSMTRAIDAVAWTFDTDAETYAKLGRAT